jgi:predicted Ser/Thr protein kinase
MRSSFPDHENSTVFAKMRVYDGESLKESDPKARSVQEYKDAAGVDEGMDGASTRFAFKVLAATFNHDTAELGADKVHGSRNKSREWSHCFALPCSPLKCYSSIVSSKAASRPM